MKYLIMCILPLLFLGCNPNKEPETLEQFKKSELTRGDMETVGDIRNGIRRIRNQFPDIKNKMIICAGAGCPIKLPYQFIPKQIEEIKATMDSICTEDNPNCELKRLSYAVIHMENVIYRNRLKDLHLREQRIYHVKTDGTFNPYYEKQLILDCVDQTMNGISYLMILKNVGLMKHHSIEYPGHTLIGYVLPHYYTRIKAIESKTLYKFDLYHRGKFGIPPVIQDETEN